MRDKEELFTTLEAIDGRDFSEYGQLVGDFDFSRFVLKLGIIQAQSDGDPTLFVVSVPQFTAGFPQSLYSTPIRRVALEDYLTRRLVDEIEDLAHYDETGISRRRLSVAAPGQKILPRSSVVVSEELVEARIYLNLPEREGLILGETAKEIFFEDLPNVVNQSLIYCNLEGPDVERFVHMMEDADQVRQVLPTRGWVSFVHEGARVGRIGDSDLPDEEEPRRFDIAENLLTEVDTLNMGSVRGFGVPAGVTLILGDTQSGRRELMHALAAGIYNHVPGDGRELVITTPDAVYVSSEPDRSVQRVDISPFLRTSGANGTSATTYTSFQALPLAAQAAATVEALEIGARALLFDESDSSPAFLASDTRLDGLFSPGSQTTTPLSARARQLADELGVSVVVAGSTSVAEFIPVADTVLKIEGWRVEDVTEQAKALAVKAPEPASGGTELSTLSENSRWIVPSSIDPSSGRHDTFIVAPDTKTLIFGRCLVELTHVNQLADVYQTSTIGLVMNYAKTRYMDQGRPIREALDLVDRDLSSEGLEVLTRDLRGDLARPRRYEIAAALNRLFTLRISGNEEEMV